MTSPPQTDPVIRSLQLAILIVSAQQRRSPDSRLGFTQINYGRLFVRDPWTLFSIARELNCSVSELVSPPEQANGTRWPALVDAAETLLSAVQAQPPHLRAPLLLRCATIPWTRVAALLPGRVKFSLQEDVATACAAILRTCGDEVDLLTSSVDESALRSSRKLRRAGLNRLRERALAC